MRDKMPVSSNWRFDMQGRWELPQAGWFVFVFDCEAWVFFLKAPSEAELR